MPELEQSAIYESFRHECGQNARQASRDLALREKTQSWLAHSGQYKYSYNFTWLQRPVIQYPQDIVAVQELIWEVKPDLIVETGIAHGGSLILSASMLALIDYTEAATSGTSLEPKKSRSRVLGIDVDIRAHNRAAIEAHPLAH